MGFSLIVCLCMLILFVRNPPGPAGSGLEGHALALYGQPLAVFSQPLAIFGQPLAVFGQPLAIFSQGDKRLWITSRPGGMPLLGLNIHNF